jgi:hemerythrin-like domain-containing protein
MNPGLCPPPREPLDFILAAHLDHRRMCREIEHLAETGDFDPTAIAALVDFIRFDLTLHVLDEEEDFFPLLRLRCQPEDGIDQLLDQMTADHIEDAALSARVRDAFNACLVEHKPPSAFDGACETLRVFAGREKRHLALENAVVVPLARRRLTPEDLAQLGARFATRRRLLFTGAPNDEPQAHFE